MPNVPAPKPLPEDARVNHIVARILWILGPAFVFIAGVSMAVIAYFREPVTASWVVYLSLLIIFGGLLVAISDYYRTIARERESRARREAYRQLAEAYENGADAESPDE